MWNRGQIIINDYLIIKPLLPHLPAYHQIDLPPHIIKYVSILYRYISFFKWKSIIDSHQESINPSPPPLLLRDLNIKMAHHAKKFKLTASTVRMHMRTEQIWRQWSDDDHHLVVWFGSLTRGQWPQLKKIQKSSFVFTIFNLINTVADDHNWNWFLVVYDLLINPQSTSNRTWISLTLDVRKHVCVSVCGWWWWWSESCVWNKQIVLLCRILSQHLESFSDQKKIFTLLFGPVFEFLPRLITRVNAKLEPGSARFGGKRLIWSTQNTFLLDYIKLIINQSIEN